MSYSQHFGNDVFISYSHADNTEGWVDTFHRRLQNRLTQLGAPATVWRDAKLGGMDVFSDEIFEQLNASAVLVSIVSPNSVTSRWCQSERQKFEQSAGASGGIRHRNRLRAAKVVKTPLKHDAHRDLFGTLGFEFYARDHRDGPFTEFAVDSDTFTTKLDELAQTLYATLTELRQHSPHPAFVVYVAAVADALEEPRKTIVRQLQDWGCTVLPDPPELSHSSSTLRQRVNADLAHCNLSVHIFGEQRGFIPDEEDESILLLQYRMACERGVERITFSPAGTSIHPAIATVLSGDAGPGIDRIEDKTLDRLLEALEERIRRRRSDTPRVEQQTPNLYVICDDTDWESALEVQTCLSGRYGVWLPIRHVGEQRLRLRDHREALRRSDAALLYWGRAEEGWFRRNLWELLSARTKRRNQFLPAVCVSSPPVREREQYRRPDLRFEQVDELRCDSLRTLVSSLLQTPR